MTTNLCKDCGKVKKAIADDLSTWTKRLAALEKFNRNHKSALRTLSKLLQESDVDIFGDLRHPEVAKVWGAGVSYNMSKGVEHAQEGLWETEEAIKTAIRKTKDHIRKIS